MLTILLQLAGGTAFLYYGADFLVKGGVSIATRFGVSALVIGLTLVAFATSAPELVVSVQAALAGSSDISIGNVIGSNICNIALILGLSAVIAPLSVHSKVLRFDLPVMTAVTLAMAAIGLLLGGFNRLTGAVFFAGLLAYIAWNIRLEKRDGSGDAETEIREEVENSRKYPLWLAAAFVIGGAAALVLGGKFIVDGAVGLGRMAHLAGERLAFLKDTCCDPAAIAGKLRACAGTSLRLYNANLTTCLESLKLGAAGYSGTSANFYPGLLAELCRCFRDDPERARELQQFFNLVQRHVEFKYPRSAKHFLNRCGVPMDDFCRIGCDRLSAEQLLQQEALRNYIERFAIREKSAENH